MKYPNNIERFVILAAVVVCLSAIPASGGLHTYIGFQEQQYRERQVLDPQSDEWSSQAVEPETTPAGELDQARSLLARGKPKQARRQLEDWTEHNPDHERYFEGIFLLGESWFECRNYYKAYEQYEVVVENTGGELFRAALRREKDVALAFLSGEKRIVWGFMRLPAEDEAIEILDRIWERVPGTSLGEEALLIKADHFFNTGDMLLAQDEYAHLAREYPAGRFLQPAMLRSAEAAEAAFPGIRFDDRPLLEADERYHQVQSAFPAYAEREKVAQRLEGIRQQRAEKDLDIARWYQRTQQPASAEFYYRLILRDWPDTLAAAEARKHLRSMGVDAEAQESQP